MKPAAAIPVALVPEERTYLGLRRFDFIIGCLHLIQGIFIWAISNATTFPVHTNFLQFDVQLKTLVPNPALV